MANSENRPPLPSFTLEEAKKVAQSSEAAAPRSLSSDVIGSSNVEQQPTTININTAEGQRNIPIVQGSTASADKPLAEQLQGPGATSKIGGVKIESVPADQLFTRPLTEDEILRSPFIEARSFDYSGNEVKVELIDHSYVPRWVQNGGHSAGGNWLAKMLGWGFVYCKEEDIRPEYREKFRKDEHGHFVIPPDLVLMKMQASNYYGRVKGNMEEAQRRVARRTALERAKTEAIKDMSRPGSLVGNPDSVARGIGNFRNDLETNKAAFYVPEG